MAKKSPAKVTVDPRYCKGCGLCITVCPIDGLEVSGRLSERGIHPVCPAEGARCTRCLKCVVMCPDAAIKIE